MGTSPTNDVKDKLLSSLISPGRNSINKDNSIPSGDKIKEISVSNDFDLQTDPLGLGLSSQNKKELSQQQLEKLRNLQNPYYLYDEVGNVIMDDK